MSNHIATIAVGDVACLACHDACAVADGLLKTNGSDTLEMSSNVVDDPGHVAAYYAVHTRCSNER